MKTHLSLIIVFYDLGKEHITYTAHWAGNLYYRAEEYAYKLLNPNGEMLIVNQGEKEFEVQKELLKTKLYRKKGCKECGYLGYTGRIGIYEVMPITREIKKLIAQGAHDIEIEESAVSAGMKTLKYSCLNHIVEGNTTADEFIRVLGYASE